MKCWNRLPLALTLASATKIVTNCWTTILTRIVCNNSHRTFSMRTVVWIFRTSSQNLGWPSKYEKSWMASENFYDLRRFYEPNIFPLGNNRIHCVILINLNASSFWCNKRGWKLSLYSLAARPPRVLSSTYVDLNLGLTREINTGVLKNIDVCSLFNPRNTIDLRSLSNFC